MSQKILTSEIALTTSEWRLDRVLLEITNDRGSNFTLQLFQLTYSEHH